MLLLRHGHPVGLRIGSIVHSSPPGAHERKGRSYSYLEEKGRDDLHRQDSYSILPPSPTTEMNMSEPKYGVGSVVLVKADGPHKHEACTILASEADGSDEPQYWVSVADKETSFAESDLQSF